MLVTLVVKLYCVFKSNLNRNPFTFMDDESDDLNTNACLQDEEEEEEANVVMPVRTPKTRRAKPKVSQQWTDSNIFRLIALVEANPSIWNVAMKEYSNKVIRSATWASIADQFGSAYNEAELTAKWTNLRIQYRGYNARAKTKSGQGVENATKWKFFNAMSFIGRAEDQQRAQSTSNLITDDSNESESL